jgi:hypothetical protein
VAKAGRAGIIIDIVGPGEIVGGEMHRTDDRAEDSRTLRRFVETRVENVAVSLAADAMAERMADFSPRRRNLVSLRLAGHPPRSRLRRAHGLSG